MSKHARLSPSNTRWPVCPGSVREESRYEDVSGEAAIDGTGSHLLLEMCLENNVRAEVYDQQIIGANHEDNPNGWLVAPDRIARVQMGLDYITRRVEELNEQFPNSTITVESEGRVDPGGAWGRDDWWGTCDITITARHEMTGEVLFLEVADYKDGRGYVSEKSNTQLTAYLFGKMRPYISTGVEQVLPLAPSYVGDCRMTIIQPKTNPVVRYVNVSPVDVTVTTEELIEAAKLTDDPKAPLVSGSHCQWCKANPKRGGHCTEASKQSLEVIEKMSGDTETEGLHLFEYISKVLADPKSLSEEELAQMADAEEGIQAVFDTVKKEMEERIEAGIDVPGYAMQPGKGSNKWKFDDEDIAKKLKTRKLKNDDVWVKKIISPAQVKKLEMLDDKQKKRIWNDMVEYTEGGLTLKKVAVEKGSAKEMFSEPNPVTQAESQSEQPVSFL